jgi:hypothetical protein
MGTNSFTVEVWYKKISSVITEMTVIRKGLTSSGTPAESGYGFSIYNNLIRFSTNDGVNGYGSSVTEPSINTWHHIVGVVDRQSLRVKLFIDGAQISPTTITTLNSVNTNIPFTIGCLVITSPACSFPLNGFIDLARLYNAVITASQIKESYYLGLNSLLANRVITNEEYLSRINQSATNE